MGCFLVDYSHENTNISKSHKKLKKMIPQRKEFEPISDELEKIGEKIVHAAYTVHKELGPGLLEKIYEACFCYELNNLGLNVKRQINVPIKYDDLEFEEGLRLDVLVEDKIICELKAVDDVNPLWEAQTISYLKLADKRLGYLINFNVKNIGKGIKRYVK